MRDRGQVVDHHVIHTNGQKSEKNGKKNARKLGKNRESSVGRPQLSELQPLSQIGRK